jgi:hypothetical protein
MSRVVTLGEVPWSRADLRAALEEFSSLYEDRPIQANTGGMRAPHAFLAWFALRALNPRAIIESGVWLGQGTWLIEKACPEAQIYCIDPNLKRIRYRSARAEYFDRDFATLGWNHLPKRATALFFDDHQNACERIKTAKSLGFRHLIFEDNYPPLQGDCYSLKQALNSPKSADAEYLRDNLETYYELPPIFKPERTRWGDAWGEEHYPTPEPLLSSVDQAYQQQYLDEAIHYTWMCYARLK